MRVRMKTRYANGVRAIEPDQVADLPDDEAADLISKGFALPAEADPSHVEGIGAKQRKATPEQPDKAPAKKVTPAKTAPAKAAAPAKKAPAKAAPAKAAAPTVGGEGDGTCGEGGS